MSDVVIDNGGAQHAPDAAEPHLGWALAGMSAGAGVIHFAMTPLHASVGWEEPLGFALAGWFQLAIAGIVLAGRGSKRVYQAAVIGNVILIGMWAWSRITGLPFGETPGVAEDVGAIDAVAVALQVGVVLIGLRLLIAPERRSIGRLAPALVAVAALGLVTTVITSPDAADHGGDETAAAPVTLASMQQDIDDTRCDTDFNHASYWDEADTAGVDTYFGGNPPAIEGAPAAAAAGGHHGAGAAAVDASASTTTVPDPNEGRGSPGLDALISATSLAATSEGAAASLIGTMSDSSDEDYDAWLWWLRQSQGAGHDTAVPAGQVVSGHGGHAGAQPWVAMTNSAQCERLGDEVDLARETALEYPTTADAVEAGYELTTGYVPGIAAHYIKYDLIDGTFEIDQPEMILYDGSDPDSAVVGLSYYLWHAGETAPTQGFTGDNDESHRHIGLCSSSAGVVIGDSTTTNEECEARGGSKGDGSKGWMSHAWVVPGCESPWGIFSAANPVLDPDLGDASAEDGGGCGGSGVRDRYGLDEQATDDESTSDTAGG